jgi:hypothetical protein
MVLLSSRELAVTFLTGWVIVEDIHAKWRQDGSERQPMTIK